MNKDQTHILGCKLDLRSQSRVTEDIFSYLRSSDFHHLVTLNPEICLHGEQDEHYRKLINKTELTVRDAFGLGLGAFLLGTKASERITGRKLLQLILQASLRQKASVYLVGGEGDTAERAAQGLKDRAPQLNIVGAEEGVKRGAFTTNTPDLIDRINKSGAKVLLVAFGAPKQEEWIAANRDKLTNIRIAVGLGGIFDYLAGNVPSPPMFMRKIGLEWLFRLITQPSRWKRILRATVKFPFTCLIWRFRMFSVYRKNVVGVIHNEENKLLLVSPHWSKSVKWQFPQGGVDEEEYPAEAIIREMSEELGTDHFKIEQNHPGVYRYNWPKWYRLLRGYRGQKQDLFILSFTGKDSDIDITQEGELSNWKWVDRKKVLGELAPARKSIGHIALKYLD